MTSASAIRLSAPDVGHLERALLLEAFDSGWIAPVGPMVERFEAAFAERVQAPAAAALASGTAALHLGLLLAGVAPGDEVVVPSLTFAATANAVMYTGARPVFVDSEAETWNIDPELVERLLEDRAESDRLPKALLTVDLFGQCAQHDRLLEVANRFGVPVIEDAAEALGGSWKGVQAGSFGQTAAFSFNGNKIMTTSGGGMLVGPRELVDRARWLAAQAREPMLHYEHQEVGFNYRMSNLLAAVGVAQLLRLDDFLERRKRNRYLYEIGLSNIEGIDFMPQHVDGTPNNWLTVIQLDPALGSPATLCEALAAEHIEARPAWKPMHLQPVYQGCEMVGGAVSEQIFDRGVCLPSGSVLCDSDIERVVEETRTALRR